MIKQSNNNARFARIPLVHFKTLNAWVMDGALVVFDQQSARLQVLDDLAAWLLLSLDAGLTRDQLADELREQSHDVALIESAYATIDQLGKNAATPSDFRQEYAHVIDSVPDLSDCSDDGIYLSLLGKVFLLQTNMPELADYLHTLSLADEKLEQKAVDYRFEIRADNSVYQFECNGIELIKVREYAHILPVLMDSLQIIAYQSSDYLLAVHSAVVSIQGQGVLFPGCSGSGKSTLAVSLMSQGYDCYSDEIAVLSSQTLQVMPLQLPAALKSGSWQLMRQYFSDMDDLSVWSRADGRLSKYLPIPHATEELIDIPVACIVFPNYDATEEQAKLIPLTPLLALMALVDAGYQVRETLTADKIEHILAWVNAVPAYRLHYSCLTSAHHLIQKALQASEQYEA